MLKIILFSFLFVMVFSIGVFIGMWIYRNHMNKHTGEYLADFIGNIIEQNGLIPFYDDALSLHILRKKDYDSLLLNILKQYDPDIPLEH